MKKAKYNIVCDNKVYEQGKLYSVEEVSHLDQNDFEDVAEEVKVDTDTSTSGVTPEVIE